MRIIAGKYGGRVIKTPVKQAIHPMSERIRNAIFNKMAVEISGAVVLDCFAGSGSIGIEALSRDAKKVYFIEKDYQAQKVIKQNLELLAVDQNDYKIIPTTIVNWLDSTDQLPQADLIFADPPYQKIQNNSVIVVSKLLKTNGKLVLSNPKSAQDLSIPGLELIDSRIYAEAKINFYQKGES